ncbi:MAG: serine protease [Actinobacteria bacterium]|nr:serine protease [Actinomycetota bacterium]MBV8961074.1 serine protease [Actinomycetota bacterium]
MSARDPFIGDGMTWRERLVPRTVLGMAVLILAFAVGAAFSGVVFYSYYQFRKDKSDAYIKNFNSRYSTAQKTIQAETNNAKAEIQKQLEPIQKVQAQGQQLADLLKNVQPSVWFVRTLDEQGQPSVGSAFVVASDSNQSLLLTSLAAVRAATHNPGPPITLEKGDQQLKATLWTWQDERDLALLIAQKGSLPKLDFAPRDPALKTGDHLFAISGLGAAGGSITQGTVADVSGSGIQHDAAIGPAFQGGPLVNAKGQVWAVASRAYSPVGFTTDSVFFGIPIRTACDKVLKCPNDVAGSPGSKGGG